MERKKKRLKEARVSVNIRTISRTESVTFPHRGGVGDVSRNIIEKRERPESPNTLEVVCRELTEEHSGMLQGYATLRSQLSERDKKNGRKFGFIPSLPDKQSPMCLLCNKVLGNDAMKPSKLQDHLRRCHPDKTDLKYFQTLKDTFQKRPTLDRMFATTSQRNDDGLRVSYNISLLIAKSGKPHTIGEKLILPAVEEVLKTVLHKPASDIIKRIPLSNNTVERRIDVMSSDIESFLCNYLRTTHFSIQPDESNLPDNAALLLAYVRFIMNQEIYEELLFARTLITDTKGELIFHVLKDYFIEKAIPLSNIISVATDGAPAMVGRYRGFISYLKQNVSGVLAIHCVIHRQHLVAKNLDCINHFT
ncbi:unnamed protein product [Acanthoscelides obtectus]|uniref:SCAN domain-containing protein 3 n=1 Tax=Acanthoscelides obtectus TaxID=200917 RepID=A0A9P0P553_ACAOB|nr:unnamed protein product [Acanthoscelides obtectus]CAK1628442.1 Protein ZBED8 [Acanthoscelides obtectus]